MVSTGRPASTSVNTAGPGETEKDTEPGSALKNGDGYVEIVMDAEYSAAAIHQPDGTERKKAGLKKARKASQFSKR